jgi:hypothetical protein
MEIPGILVVPIGSPRLRGEQEKHKASLQY